MSNQPMVNEAVFARVPRETKARLIDIANAAGLTVGATVALLLDRALKPAENAKPDLNATPAERLERVIGAGR